MPTCKAQRHNRLTFFSDESRHKGHHKRPTPRLNPPSTMGPSTRWTPNLHNRVGHTPTTQLGALKHNNRVGHTPTTQLGAPKHNNRLGSNDPRVTSSQLHFHESPWRTQTDATNAMARTQVLKSFTLKSHQKQLMLMRGEKRKNKEELNK